METRLPSRWRPLVPLVIAAAFTSFSPTAPARGETPAVTVAYDTVTVFADRTLGTVTMRHGFLHGKDEQLAYLDSAMVADLAPGAWRLYKAPSYNFARHYDPVITYGVCDVYAWQQGGFPSAKPWLDWDEWESYVAWIFTTIRSLYPLHPVSFWDIWNEPDHPYFWTGTFDQLVETFARAINVIHGIDPEAKIVGPSISWFRPGNPGVAGIVPFLVALDTEYGIRLDAISWHENGGATHGGPRPDGIPGNADFLRNAIAANFPPEYQPELHVNEYAGKQEHLSPGWSLGYLYYLEAAGIDFFTRACWDTYAGESPPYDVWSDCWAGLNGMFMHDGITPQPAYWLYEAYADREGLEKLAVASTDPLTNLLASHDVANEKLHLLAGRHFNALYGDVFVRVTGFPYPDGTVRVTGERIRNYAVFYADPPKSMPLPGGPQWMWEQTLQAVDGTIEFEIDSFQEGEAWIVTIERGPASGVAEASSGPALRVWPAGPNPFLHAGAGVDLMIRFTLPETLPVSLRIHDARGRLVAILVEGTRDAGEHAARWSALDIERGSVAPGVYFARLTAGSHTATTRLVLAR